MANKEITNETLRLTTLETKTLSINEKWKWKLKKRCYLDVSVRTYLFGYWDIFSSRFNILLTPKIFSFPWLFLERPPLMVLLFRVLHIWCAGEQNVSTNNRNNLQQTTNKLAWNYLNRLILWIFRTCLVILLFLLNIVLQTGHWNEGIFPHSHRLWNRKLQLCAYDDPHSHRYRFCLEIVWCNSDDW